VSLLAVSLSSPPNGSKGTRRCTSLHLCQEMGDKPPTFCPAPPREPPFTPNSVLCTLRSTFENSPSTPIRVRTPRNREPPCHSCPKPSLFNSAPFLVLVGAQHAAPSVILQSALSSSYLRASASPRDPPFVLHSLPALDFPSRHRIMERTLRRLG